MRTPSAWLIYSAASARTDNATGRLWGMRLEGVYALREAFRWA